MLEGPRQFLKPFRDCRDRWILCSVFCSLELRPRRKKSHLGALLIGDKSTPFRKAARTPSSAPCSAARAYAGSPADPLSRRSDRGPRATKPPSPARPFESGRPREHDQVAQVLHLVARNPADVWCGSQLRPAENIVNELEGCHRLAGVNTRVSGPRQFFRRRPVENLRTCLGHIEFHVEPRQTGERMTGNMLCKAWPPIFCVLGGSRWGLSSGARSKRRGNRCLPETLNLFLFCGQLRADRSGYLLENLANRKAEFSAPCLLPDFPSRQEPC
jgi:hypothetical protein